MIQVIIVDTINNVQDSVAIERNRLKYDGMARMSFTCDINHMLKVLMDKLKQEVKEENE